MPIPSRDVATPSEIAQAIALNLDGMAVAKLTAMKIYLQVLQLVFVQFGMVATPTQLLEILSHYNSTNYQKYKLPLGSAHVSRDAHALFMSELADKSRLPIEAISPGLAMKVAGMFDEIVAELGSNLHANLQTTFDSRLEMATAKFTTESAIWLQERNGFMAQTEELKSELFAQTTRANAQESRSDDLLSQLDTLRRQVNALEVREGILKLRLADVEKRNDAVEREKAELVSSEREERQLRLQLLDTTRQQALQLQAVTTKFRAANDNLTTLIGEREKLEQRNMELSLLSVSLRKRLDAYVKSEMHQHKKKPALRGLGVVKKQSLKPRH